MFFVFHFFLCLLVSSLFISFFFLASFSLFLSISWFFRIFCLTICSFCLLFFCYLLLLNCSILHLSILRICLFVTFSLLFLKLLLFQGSQWLSTFLRQLRSIVRKKRNNFTNWKVSWEKFVLNAVVYNDILFPGKLTISFNICKGGCLNS